MKIISKFGDKSSLYSMKGDWRPKKKKKQLTVDLVGSWLVLDEDLSKDLIWVRLSDFPLMVYGFVCLFLMVKITSLDC